MSASAVVQQPSAATYRSKPTQSRPKHTLFGSELEMHSKQDKASLQKCDLKAFEEEQQSQRVARQNRYKAMLPDNLKKSLPANHIVEHSRNEVSKQIGQSLAAKQNLESLETSSLYFQVGLHGTTPPARSGQDNGLANDPALGQPSPTRHKQSPEKPPVHQYSLQGDVLRPGMDLDKPDAKSDPIDKSGPYSYKRHKAPDWLPRDYFIQKAANERKPQGPLITTIDLPPNIQHQFGSSICKNVLSNQDKVDEALAAHRRLRESGHMRRPRVGQQSRNSTPGSTTPPKTDPMYEELGNALRQDMFPGQTTDHRVSVAHSVYTDDIHRRRVQDPDQWRYQRDQLSTWAEQNVLRERMKKAWDSYLTDVLQKKAD